MEAGRRTHKKDRRLPVNTAWVKGWHSLLEGRTGQVELPETAEQERKRVQQHRVPKTPLGRSYQALHIKSEERVDMWDGGQNSQSST